MIELLLTEQHNLEKSKIKNSIQIDKLKDNIDVSLIHGYLLG